MGPFRTTLSRRGVGWSFGILGFRYGITTTGRRYISVGIPGTGLYGIQYLNLKTSPKQQSAPSSIPPPIVHRSAQNPAPIVQQARQKWWQQKNLP
jgi:hypothetical protein